MKKRILVFGAILTMAALTLCGCANSKKNYENELEIVTELLEIDYDGLSPEEISKEISELVGELKAKTDEGKVLQEDFDELNELVIDATGILAEFTRDNSSKFDKKVKNIEELGEDLEEHLEDFLDAADDAGVRKSRIEDVEDIDLPDLMKSAAKSIKGTRAADYYDDTLAITECMQEFEKIVDNEDFSDFATKSATFISELEVRTPGGRAFKLLLQDLVGCLNRILELESIYGIDTDKYWDVYYEIMDEYEEIGEEMEDEIDDFLDKAEDMGIDEKILDILWEIFW